MHPLILANPAGTIPANPALVSGTIPARMVLPPKGGAVAAGITIKRTQGGRVMP